MSAAEQSGPSQVATLEGRRLALWEIASVVSSALIAEWTILPFVGQEKWIGAIPVLLAFALMFYSHRVRRETARELGWRFDNFLRAARLLALPMSLACVLLIIVGWLTNGLNNHLLARAGGRSLMWLPAWGILWGLLQQYVLQAFVNRRAQVALGSGWRSVLLVAAVFALLHFPNPWLSLATFAGGVIWASVYQRAPNIPALALSHSLMTLVLIWTLPASALSGLRVGFNYFG
ncbi:MAG TPA: CPBP family intramembrane glutamic endopeptidase [Pyrinomonadaceae bacterium]